MITQNDLINKGLQVNAPLTVGQILKSIIDEDKASPEKQNMSDGVNYYKIEQDIVNRTITYSVDGVNKYDRNASNNKVQHPFHRLLVTQKTAYILGNRPVITVEDERTQKEIDTYLTDDFFNMLNKWETQSSNKGKEWLHIYIDEKGQFKYRILSAQQIIPIYDNRFQDQLLNIIRYYEVSYVDGKGKEDKRLKAEWWNDKEVWFFVQNASGEFESEVMELNPRPHFLSTNTADKEKKKVSESWGRLPFIELLNNDDAFTDLQLIKTLIDDFDLNVSDFSNNLADIQEAIWLLMGYEGTSLSEFRNNLKVFRAIKLSSGGDAKPQTMEIPKDARDSHLNRLEENIFTFGMGVKSNTDKFGNSPSGIALKFLYGLLDLKANLKITQLKKSIKDFFWFAGFYMNDRKNIELNSDDLTIVFNKSIVINEKEKVEIAQINKGIISDKTNLANHPYVDNVGKELELIESESENIVDLDDE